MSTQPTKLLQIIEQFGPHRQYTQSGRSGAGEPDKIVRTHCCFCGMQCGIQLKVKDNAVVGFEPWDEFPSNQGMLCPKGVKRYLQGEHRDRLLTAYQRDPAAPSGFRALPYEEAIKRVASEIDRIQKAYGPNAFAVLGGASLTTEKAYLLGKFARMCLRTCNIDYNGRLCMVSAAAANKKALGVDRSGNPWTGGAIIGPMSHCCASNSFTYSGGPYCGTRRTAHTLYSGIFEIGSWAAMVTWLMLFRPAQ